MHPGPVTETTHRTLSGARHQPLHAAQIADALLRLTTAGVMTGLSESTLRRKAKSDPSFPRLIKLGQRCTRIRAGDLTTWLRAQADRPSA